MKEFEEIELLLRSICFKVKIAGRHVLKDFDLTASQFDILQHLHFDGPKRMTELSKGMGVTKSTMTGLVLRLESAGYVEKLRFAKDKRVSVVGISVKGERIIKKVVEKRVMFISASLDNAERLELLSSLRKISKAISNEFDQLEKS